MKLINSKYKLAMILVTALILALGSLSVSKRLNFAPIKPKDDALATSNAITISDKIVTALGRIEPKNKVIKLAGPSYLYSGRVIQLLVKEGERVKQGQIIAYLDILSKQQAVLAAAKQKVQVAIAQLNQVLAGSAKKGEISAQVAAIANLEAEFQGQIATQKAKIARLKAEFIGQKDAQAATITRLRENWSNAEIDCQRYNTLFAEGAVSKATRDSQCLKAKVARQQLKEAEANQERILETLPQEINEADSTMKQILSTFPQRISQAKATLNQLQEVRPTDVEVAQSELSQAIAAVTEAEADLDLAYVKAPVSGQILKIHTWPGESIGSEGIADLGQTQEMYVVAEVYETDIGQIKPGQVTTISNKSLSGNLRGKVEQISLQLGKKNVFNNDPSLDIDARIFEVKIKINSEYNEEAARFINLQVEVAIHTDSYVDK